MTSFETFLNIISFGCWQNGKAFAIPGDATVIRWWKSKREKYWLGMGRITCLPKIQSNVFRRHVKSDEFRFKKMHWLISLNLELACISLHPPRLV